MPLEVVGQIALLSVYRELEGIPGRAAIAGVLSAGNYFACSAASKFLYRKTFNTKMNSSIQYSASLRDQTLYRSASKSIKRLPSAQRDIVRKRASSVLSKSERFSKNSQTMLLAFFGCKTMFGMLSEKGRGGSLLSSIGYGVFVPTSVVLDDFLKTKG